MKKIPNKVKMAIVVILAIGLSAYALQHWSAGRTIISSLDYYLQKAFCITIMCYGEEYCTGQKCKIRKSCMRYLPIKNIPVMRVSPVYDKKTRRCFNLKAKENGR